MEISQSIKKYHIFHFIPTFESGGGMELVLCNIINGLPSKFRHSIFSLNGGYDVKCFILKPDRVNYIKMLLKNKSTIKRILLIKKLLRNEKPDLLVTYNWGSFDCVIANYLFCNIHHIHTEHGFNHDEMNMQKIIRKWARITLLNRIYYFIAPSITLKEKARKEWKIDKQKIVYIPNGIDIDNILNTIHVKNTFPKDSIIIGTVGSLKRVKNHLKLLRIFSKLHSRINKNIYLQIIGSGSEYRNLKNFITLQNLGDKIFLLGHIDNPIPYVKNFDIFCITSDTEQMPLALLEAMACKCPIVSTDVGDIKNVVAKNNVKYVVLKNDDNAYLSSLNELINNKKLRESIGESNFKKCIKRYSAGSMIKLYENLFNSILSIA